MGVVYNAPAAAYHVGDMEQDKWRQHCRVAERRSTVAELLSSWMGDAG